MMYLLDTAVVLALRTARRDPDHAALAAWAAAVPQPSLFLSALTLIELDTSAARLAKRDKAGAAALRAWIETQAITAFEGRILPVDAAIVRRRATLNYTDTRDGLLAATALEHQLVLATRDTAAFRSGRVRLLDPWRHVVAAEDEDWSSAGRAGAAWLRNWFIRA